jgi:hypothetical protein
LFTFNVISFKNAKHEDIVGLNVTKILQNFLANFCEFHPWIALTSSLINSTQTVKLVLLQIEAYQVPFELKIPDELISIEVAFSFLQFPAL